MKKWIRVTLIVAACVLAVGLLTGGMGLYTFWATADRYTPENPVDRDYAVDASALTSLRVDVSLGSVRTVSYTHLARRTASTFSRPSARTSGPK